MELSGIFFIWCLSTLSLSDNNTLFLISSLRPIKYLNVYYYHYRDYKGLVIKQILSHVSHKNDVFRKLLFYHKCQVTTVKVRDQAKRSELKGVGCQDSLFIKLNTRFTI